MKIRNLGRLATLAVVAGMVMSFLPAPAAAQEPLYFYDQAFEQIWQRNDRPVEQMVTNRSWTWGLNSNNELYSGQEPYKQGRNGLRDVQYFDKARMEINDRTMDVDDPYYVTNGRLVSEMVSGRYVIGDEEEDTVGLDPSNEAVAGDPARHGTDSSRDNGDAPTYASFEDVATLRGDERGADNRVGQPVDEMIDRDGDVSDLPSGQSNLAELTEIAHFNTNLKHNIPDKFWSFLTQTGTIYDAATGRYVQNGSVFQPWIDVMGLPITEPYWMVTNITRNSGDREIREARWVMVQLFERRVLTYNPANDLAFQVEMGNVGQHYYRWRYGQTEGDTADDNRPEIRNLERTNLTATSATIEWETTRDATSELRYGTDDDNLSSIAGSGEYRTEHRVELDDLEPDTVYYFRVISRDRNGRVVDTDGQSNSFLTPAE